MPQEKNKEIVKTMLEKMITHFQCDAETVSTYFSDDYVQYVDKKVLDKQGLSDHMGKLPKRFKSMSVTFLALIAEDDRVFSSHIVRAISPLKEKIFMHSMAYFILKDYKIIQCTELTRFIENPEQDVMLTDSLKNK